ncbi:hypothetical protein Tco_1368462 [Tanacetum coccineum]
MGGQNHSYVNVVKGKANETKYTIEKKVVKVIMLDSNKPLLEHVGRAKAIFAKAKHLHSILNKKALCMAEGFLELSLKIARILKALVLGVLSIVHSLFKSLACFYWESDILNLID